jgi:hypothetical protein
MEEQKNPKSSKPKTRAKKQVSLSKKALGELGK